MDRLSRSSDGGAPRQSTPAVKVLRWLAPFVVTGAALAWVFSRIGLRAVAERVTGDALAILLPVILIFGAFALWIEAECLVRLLPDHRHVFDRWTAARIKAASYPLALLHYAIGAGALAVLLGRRTDRRVADAAGVVALVMLFDVGVQLLMMVVGVTALGTEAPAARVGVAGLMMGTLVAGFLVLRAPIPLGPLDRVRELSIFAAARSTSLRLLAELAVLRFLFAVAFLAMIGMACRAFGIPVPWIFLMVSVPVLIVVAMIPSVAGLGTGQVAFIEVFGRYGDEENLLACSLVLSTGLILLRAGMGLVFAREFTREALVAAREAEAP